MIGSLIDFAANASQLTDQFVRDSVRAPPLIALHLNGNND